ncbi:MAG: 1-deoxy-D-xylulose-5-phosphate synthase [Halieaceae bacterium]|nr:1-deoxy-D-xylulose-5-phosphate synthase [Halieaceae bacterium]
MLTKIPTSRPSTPILDSLNSGGKVRDLSESALLELCNELRAFLLYSIGKTGGHFGAGMGVIELTVALHHVLDTPEDRIVWDVGHQTYPHKILTGRMEKMRTIRQSKGLSGFPKRSESIYDTFGVGHSSTSISSAMGMALGNKHRGNNRRVVAIIGDGAITGGMAFEALAHAGDQRPDMLVILNDNQMSIGHNRGGLATYFAKIWASKTYISLREGSKKLLKRIKPAWDLAKLTEEHMKGMVAPGTLFEELGWHYIGPLDGHDLPQLMQTIDNMSKLKGPQILHIRTVKGKGFQAAEDDPAGYHAMNKIEVFSKPAPSKKDSDTKPPKYSDVFGEWLCEAAEKDPRLVAITPAMCEGSGMVKFASKYPKQYYDVAIAEQHAVTLAAGLACEGLKPVVAIYSTFLQRGYDQLIHDVAIQNLDVTFAIDRAGLVGQDGPTHHGAFDLAYLRCIPNIVIGAPSNESICRQMLFSCYQYEGPAAVRYPRGSGIGVEIKDVIEECKIGHAEVVREGNNTAILSFGTILSEALIAGEKTDATVVDMKWVKPLDTELIKEIAKNYEKIVTIEDGSIAGGAGSAVNEELNRVGIISRIINLGIPDQFIDHAAQEEQYAICGIDSGSIISAINGFEKTVSDNQSSYGSISKFPNIK